MYIEIWTLKTKNTQYGFCGQAAFKNARGLYFFEVGQGEQHFLTHKSSSWAEPNIVPLQGVCNIKQMIMIEGL